MQRIFYVLGCTIQIEDAIINVANVQGMTDSIKFVECGNVYVFFLVF